MADTPSLSLKKSFTYRGGTKTFVNRYHFDGGAPGSDAAWDTLFDAVVAAEKLIYPSVVTIIEAIGYLAGSDVPHRTKVYSTAGTASLTNWVQTPGDTAAMLRYSTDQFSTRNHPIYLWNWFHGIGRNTASAADLLDGNQKTAIQTYGTAWLTGFSDGVTTHHRAGPRGAVAQARTVDQYIRHRDFRS